MSDRRRFSGSAVTGVDPKGRVAIPAGLRATLDHNGAASQVTIALSESGTSLIGFDPDFLDIRAGKLEARDDARLDAGEAVDANVARLAVGMTETATFDASGRFVPPAFYAMKAKLEKGSPLFFQGVGGYFEIWNMDVLEADPSVHAQVKELARFQRDQWSAK